MPSWSAASPSARPSSAQANAELEQRVEERTREREAALAQVHEMQKLESLGQLTGGVAHDFNNLLMAVLGNLELLRKRVADDPSALRLIDGAIQGAERGATLTKRMLAFARRQELKPEAVDVAKLVDSMVEMLRRSLGPTIEIATEFEPDLAADSGRSQPARTGAPEPRAQCARRDARWRASDDHRARATGSRPGRCRGSRRATMSASRSADTGAGMDEATLKRAAEPFFTTKDRGRGTGLGLSMVDGLVGQSGGAMRIGSQPGAGTTVELWLPASTAEEADRATPGLRRRCRRDPRVAGAGGRRRSDRAGEHRGDARGSRPCGARGGLGGRRARSAARRAARSTRSSPITRCRA